MSGGTRKDSGINRLKLSILSQGRGRTANNTERTALLLERTPDWHGNGGRAPPPSQAQLQAQRPLDFWPSQCADTLMEQCTKTQLSFHMCLFFQAASHLSIMLIIYCENSQGKYVRKHVLRTWDIITKEFQVLTSNDIILYLNKYFSTEGSGISKGCKILTSLVTLSNTAYFFL